MASLIKRLLIIGVLAILISCGTQDLLLVVYNNISKPLIDPFRKGIYSKFLTAMDEPELAQEPGESYRFLWLRSFHEPIVVRISCAAKKCDLTARRLNGKGGYEPGSVVEHKTRTLSEQETAMFLGLVSKAEFWLPQPAHDRLQKDGAAWVLEGIRNGRYNVWDVATPGDSLQYAPFSELCLEMLHLSGLKVIPNEVY